MGLWEFLFGGDDTPGVATWYAHMHGGPGDGQLIPLSPLHEAHQSRVGYWLDQERPEQQLRGVYVATGHYTHVREFENGDTLPIPVGFCYEWKGWVTSHNWGVN